MKTTDTLSAIARRATPWLAALLCTALAAPAAAQSSGAAKPAPAPAPAGAARPAPAVDEAELERQLGAARARLETAAREVADLSMKLNGGDMLRFFDDPDRPRRALLGVTLGDERRSGGVRLAGVSPGGPAATAGVRAGDVLVAIDGRKVSDARAIRERLRAVEPGATVKVDVERDGRQQTFAVVTRALDPRTVMLRRGGPDPDVDFDFDAGPLPGVPLVLPFGRPWGDLELATLTKDLGRYFGAERGVLVVRAPSEGGLPLRDGDVITAIDGREPRSGSHALRILRSYQPGEKATLAILRDRRAQKLEVTMPEARASYRFAVPAAPASPAAPAAPAAPPAPPAAGP